ncbi:MAG: YqjK-like family protein [Enterobacteriaceae bacterium]|nr:YqjK-like family protein [Enterobacteriaceae bacterium]
MTKMAVNSSRCQQRERKKQALLQQIQQQRQSLSEYGQQWLAITRSYDRGWQMLRPFQSYIATASSLLLLYGLFRPRKFYRWSRHMVNVLGIINTIRKILNKQ